MGLGTLLIRADASPEIGTGHVMRCLALAQAWRDAGGNGFFAMAESMPAINERIRDEGFELLHLNSGRGSQANAEELASIAVKEEVSWVVIDGYCFSRDYVASLAGAGKKVLLINDEGTSERLDVDLLLNQNLHATQRLYPWQQNQTRFLLGLRFALLRKEFLGPSRINREFSPVARKVLVTVGGGCQNHLLSSVLTALNFLPFELDVRVLAPDQWGPMPSSKQRITFEPVVGNMCEPMQWADVAVSAAGSTCWELCFSGLPSVVVDVADNQRPIAQALDTRGMALHIPKESADAGSIADALCSLIPAKERRREISVRAQELIDGRGSARVVAEMLATSIQFRRATFGDASVLWGWANDPIARSFSFFGGRIEWEDHYRWLKEKLSAPSRVQLLVAEQNAIPAGITRIEMKDDRKGEISINVAPRMRGKGIASYLIEHALKVAVAEWNLTEVHALIKPDNVPSERAFGAAGFRAEETTLISGCAAIRYVWKSTPEDDREETLLACGMES